MSSVAPGDLTASTVISLIESGAYPREIVATIARGFLPLAQEDLIGVLSYLAQGNDSEIAALSRSALGEIPARALIEYASNESIPAEQLVRLIGAVEDNVVLEALLRNRAVPDGTIAEVARRAAPRLQEVIVINQARILRAPAILDALFENPSLSPDVRRRALETREEFFDKKSRLRKFEEEFLVGAGEEEAPASVSLDAISDLLEKAEEEGDIEPTSPPPSTDVEGVDTRESALWVRLYYMSVAEKVQIAFRGDRMLRMLLVRDRNKLICSSVMRNPRLTEQEVESIAGMRNVEEEVLRLISTRRDWMSKYNILATLCRNPKTPLGVAIPLVNRLTLRDLKYLKDDKGVQNGVRETAKKMYLARTQKR